MASRLSKRNSLSPEFSLGSRRRNEYAWRSLSVFNLYRFIIALGIATLYQSGVSYEVLGSDAPHLFSMVTSIYLVLSLLAAPFNVLRKPDYPLQVWVLVGVDIVAITLISHASGGSQNGLGMLLAVNITLAALMLGQLSAFAIAALAALAMLAEQSYAYFYIGRDSRAYTQVSLYGAVYFAMTALALFVARRLQESEASEASSRASLVRAEKLNAHIIQYMSTGVLVVDRNNRILQCNHAAWVQLGMPSGALNSLLDDICIPLFKLLRIWRRNAQSKATPFRLTANTPELMPAFIAIVPDQQMTLIFLEDTSRTTQQATQMKLASLGRLTASIAHEIRNPLGAMSHAAQLLKESPDLLTGDIRLVDIIEKNCERMNGIIENIMQISQRRASQAEAITLQTFLPDFIDDFRLGRQPVPEIQVDVALHTAQIAFDNGQLRQVLANLCDNGLRYSIKKENRAIVEIHAGEDRSSGRPFIDVVDHGEGISPETAEKIFEPFFTTSSKGVGLGLYLARELCQANRAILEYVPVPSGGSCFRISCSAFNKNIPH